jgi:hypothetical protein
MAPLCTELETVVVFVALGAEDITRRLSYFPGHHWTSVQRILVHWGQSGKFRAESPVEKVQRNSALMLFMYHELRQQFSVSTLGPLVKADALTRRCNKIIPHSPPGN